MIEIRGLTKRYGDRTAVDDLTVTIRPGRVTGFLGPNGAGKSTTMRVVVGLDRHTAGTVRVDGRRYADSPAPLRAVGALLEARSAHPGRTARDHLRVLAATAGLPRSRVDAVLDLAGLTSVAGRRVGGFSLGMGQRLGVATALLGDPATVVLDEPVNGLDPDGVLWIRTLTRRLAAEGRTVLVSSHLMSEMAVTADHLVIIGRGRLIADAPLQQILSATHDARVVVRTPDATRLSALLAAPGVTVTSVAADSLEITGMTAPDVANVAASAGIPLHELTTHATSLEEAYLSLTEDSVQYRATASAANTIR